MKIVQSDIKIEFEPRVYSYLMNCFRAARSEFSGLGFMRREGKRIFIYDFVLMDVGLETFTEIQPEKILPLLDRSDAGNLKVWAHMHPMGDGVPGSHNWSPTDNNTILHSPLGGDPQLVEWSISVVLTNGGWVGRIDNYLTQTTAHLEVLDPGRQAYADVAAIRKEKHTFTPTEHYLSATEVWPAPFRQPAFSYYMDPDLVAIDEEDLVELEAVHGKDWTIEELIDSFGILRREDEVDERVLTFEDWLDKVNAEHGNVTLDYAERLATNTGMTAFREQIRGMVRSKNYTWRSPISSYLEKISQ